MLKAFFVGARRTTTWQMEYKSSLLWPAGLSRHREDSPLSNVRSGEHLAVPSILLLKLWGKSPNPAAESASCERSNLPDSSASLFVRMGSVRRGRTWLSILDWLAGSMLKHSNVSGSSKLLTERSLLSLCLQQPFFLKNYQTDNNTCMQKLYHDCSLRS